MIWTPFLDCSNIPRPYFHPHLGTNSAMVQMFGRQLVNFSSYDYLGMSSDPRVQKRAKDAIDTYGTSVSASRIVSGEIPLHGELEARIAAWHGVDDALVTTSGYLTNAAVVGYLLGPDDVAVCDSLVTAASCRTHVGRDAAGSTSGTMTLHRWRPSCRRPGTSTRVPC